MLSKTGTPGATVVRLADGAVMAEVPGKRRPKDEEEALSST